MVLATAAGSRPSRLAVAAQHVELVGDLPGVDGEQVAGVGVPGHQAQRLALAAAADQDRRARLAIGAG